MNSNSQLKDPSVALTTYPLSIRYREKLETHLDCHPTYVTANELSTLPFRKMLGRLRSFRSSTIVLPNEDEKAVAIMPIMRLLAAFSGSPAIFEVGPNLETTRLTALRLLRGMIAFVLAIPLCWAAMVRAWLAIQWLRKVRRNNPTMSTLSRLLYLKTNFAFGVVAGGAIGHVAGVVNDFIRRGYSVTYGTYDAPAVLDSRVNSLPLPILRTYGLPIEFNLYRAHLLATRLLAARKPDYELIYQRLTLGNFSGVLLSRQFNIPLIIEYNGSEAWVRRHWSRPMRFHGLADMMERVVVSHAHLVVAVSEASAEELLQMGIEPARIVWYPNCIDPRVFNPARFSNEERGALRNRYKIPRDAVVAGFIGTFGQWHGVEVMAKAIRRLLEEHRDFVIREKLHFLLVGDGLKGPEVRQILNRSDFSSFYTMTGLVPQIDAPLHLAACDLLLSPHVPNVDGSRFFGSPTKLFEYMAMGKGIVASDLEQIGEVLRPGIPVDQLRTASEGDELKALAILCRPGDVGGIVDAIIYLVQNPRVREQLGANARCEVLAKYCWEHHVDKILDGLKRVVRMTPPSYP